MVTINSRFSIRSIFEITFTLSNCYILKYSTMNAKSFIYRTEKYPAFLIRLVVGLVFLSEGLQKFLFPAVLGSGRFGTIGFVHPIFWAYFTGSFEILCGFSLLIGFFTRLTAIPLLIVMITAFVTTKWPILINQGFWKFAHEYRTDFAMTFLLIWLLIYGGNKIFADHVQLNN
jgi:putative oxidoreductase